MFKYAIINMKKDLNFEVIQTFNELSQLEEYSKANEIINDIVEIVDVSQELLYGNFILYTDYFWRRINLSDQLKDGYISQNDYDNSLNEIIHWEKDSRKSFLETKNGIRPNLNDLLNDKE